MKPEEKPHCQQALTLEKTYPHPPERVWQALTDPRALAQWLLPTTFQPVLGHRFQFTHRSREGKRRKVRCQVVELEAPRRLAYTWQAEDEEVPTLVTWTLEPIEAGVCLRLEHIGPEISNVAYGGKTMAVRLNRFLQAHDAQTQENVLHQRPLGVLRLPSCISSRSVQAVGRKRQAARVRI